MIKIYKKWEISNRQLIEKYIVECINPDYYGDDEAHQEQVYSNVYHGDDAEVKSPFQNYSDQESDLILEAEYSTYEDYIKAGWFDDLIIRAEKLHRLSYLAQ